MYLLSQFSLILEDENDNKQGRSCVIISCCLFNFFPSCEDLLCDLGVPRAHFLPLRWWWVYPLTPPPPTPQHRTWFTCRIFICAPQMAKHNILTASSSQVSKGRLKKAMCKPCQNTKEWLAGLGFTSKSKGGEMGPRYYWEEWLSENIISCMSQSFSTFCDS